MKRVYVAGPVGANDSGRRARLDAAIDAGRALLLAGFAPFVPHLWAAACDADSFTGYEAWMDYDMAFLSTCAALVRIPGSSPGADREVAEARRCGIPIYYAVEDLIAACAEAA